MIRLLPDLMLLVAANIYHTFCIKLLFHCVVDGKASRYSLIHSRQTLNELSKVLVTAIIAVRQNDE